MGPEVSLVKAACLQLLVELWSSRTMRPESALLVYGEPATPRAFEVSFELICKSRFARKSQTLDFPFGEQRKSALNELCANDREPKSG